MVLKNNNFLCICIPTYNRAQKLDNQLSRLIEVLKNPKYTERVSILISNNGSCDNTTGVAKRRIDEAYRYKISIKLIGFESNVGFDKNLINCYVRSEAQFLWFLSDDDIPSISAIEIILNSISIYHPNVIYYNFFQPPYLTDNKYIKEEIYFDVISESNIRSLHMMAMWPKLSSIVLRRFELSDEFLNIDHKFAHINLVFYISLMHGRLLHSDKFIASVDFDYLDNIDFNPHVGNLIFESIDQVMKITISEDLRLFYWQEFPAVKCDPFLVSMRHLIEVNINGLSITDELKKELELVISSGLSSRYALMLSPLFVKYIFSHFFNYFPLSLLANIRRIRRLSKGSGFRRRF